MKETEAMRWIEELPALWKSEGYGYTIYQRHSQGVHSYSPFSVFLNGNLIGLDQWGCRPYIPSLEEAQQLADRHRQDHE